MITKKQIIEIADVIKNIPLYDEQGNLIGTVNTTDSFKNVSPCDLVNAFCKFLKQENPAFMESRFRDYINGVCGPNGGKI